MTAAQISALAADREKAHLFARVPKMGWVYLAVSVMICCAFAAVVLMRMP